LRNRYCPFIKENKKLYVIIPLLDARCSFEKPLLYDDVITIKTTVSEINKRTFKFTHEVYKDEIRAGHGFEIRAWAKKEDGKLSAVPIPNDIREKLQKDEKNKTSQVNPWINA
jgi:acyl-CoA thioester hydrolase